jgi:hypothetical protein
MCQRSGSDENIGVADESAATMQLCVDFGSSHDNRISKRKDLTFPTTILKYRDLLKRPLGFQPAQDLVARDDREGEPLVGLEVLLGALRNESIATLDDFGECVRIK